MFSVDTDAKLRSLEDMRREVEELKAMAAKLKEDHDCGLLKSEELRRESVETRPVDCDLAEKLWHEAENIRDEAKECMRQSVENTMKAADIQHRIDIRSQIEAIDNYDKVWRDAVRAGRS